jgi:3-deoxy-D-manno-octulosonic-acid transferase
MKLFWEYFYNVVILPLLYVAIRSLALISRKVRRGIRGRNGLFASLETQVVHKLPAGKRVWFHASSLGEFEQAKPIIAELKRRYADVRVIVTFFSPSGYEHSKKYHLADVISYIPFDTRANARRFLDVTKPDVAVIIRYDVWPNHIWELAARNIPILIANATMRSTTKRRFPVVRNFHHHVYNGISSILTVSQRDVEAFKMFSLTKPTVEAIGDTRYDQVNIRSAEAKKKHVIADSILSGKRVIVAGSSWREDEGVLIPSFLQLRESISNLLLILVPHEPTIEHLEELETDLGGKTSSIRFSGLNDYNVEHVIIVDSIGILSTLYKYAHVAYIGGSFKQNVHNVLEAAVYGIPVVYGPKHRNSQEAVKLAERGGGFVVENEKSLYRVLRELLENDERRKKAGARAGDLVKENIGATERFLKHLKL